MINIGDYREKDTPERQDIIRKELQQAGINIIEKPDSKEITGELDGFTFTRAWYYWRAYGNMPGELAID